jgi:flagellar biosynthesis protein FlhF
MNIQKFIAPSSREALAKARHAFGDATLILSNRTTSQGVEVMATTDEALHDLGVVSTNGKTLNKLASPRSSVEEDADQLAMSTLSFQDYVRERMLRRRHEAKLAQTPTTPSTPRQASTATRPRPARVETSVEHSRTTPQSSSSDVHTFKSEPIKGQISSHIVEELQSVKSLIEERFNTLDWLGHMRRHPAQASVMLRLLKAGFSPSLSRAMVEKMPIDLNATEALDWVHQVLERNLKTDTSGSLIKQGGIYALVGATGVGKTTTAAKLAAQCVSVHGAASVGLITLDTYKSGAHEQLRQHGRMMGVVAHLAHDRAALEDLLSLLANKKMVLIDTAGLAPRDARREEILDVLNLDAIERVLVLQASAQAEAMEETVGAFRTDNPLLTILTKTDEAVKLAPALDVLIRHQLVVKGLTMGQRVPEDWADLDKPQLVRQALRSPQSSAFDPQMDDLSYLFSQPQGLMTHTRMH